MIPVFFFVLKLSYSPKGENVIMGSENVIFIPAFSLEPKMSRDTSNTIRSFPSSRLALRTADIV